MSDQHPDQWMPPVDGPPQDLAPAPAVAAPRRTRAKVALTALTGVLVVAAVGFGVSSLAQGDGASSAEGAVTELFEAVDRQDAIGVAESLEPTERHILVDALKEAAVEARRVEVTDDRLDLRDVDGVDLKVEGLQMHSAKLDDETYAVDIDAGQISSRTQLSKLPLGRVVQEVIDRNEDVGEPVDDASKDAIDLTGTRIVAVKRGGEWYVSALFSLAEQIRLDLDPIAQFPKPGSAIPAVGADSPEAAVREGVAAATGADIGRLIELTPAEEARVLHTYGPILVAEAKGDDTGVTVDDLELDVSDAPGGRKKVSATSMTMTWTTEWDRQVTTYDGTCSTTTWEALDPEDLGDDEGFDSSGEWKVCDDEVSSLSPFGFFNVLYTPGSTDVIVEEHDGKWFLSPTGTVLQNTIGTLKGLDVDQVRRIARSWGGEWWLYQPSEVWEACGVDQPSLDDSRADAEAAYEECMQSLPEDYTGPWGPFGGSPISSSDDYSALGDECYGTATSEDSMDAVEACLADLVASGQLDQSELDAFRCSRIYEAIPYDESLSEAENEKLWDQAEAQYDACIEAGTAGDEPIAGPTFGGGGETPSATPSTTRPSSSTASTAPPTTTTTSTVPSMPDDPTSIATPMDEVTG